MKEIKSQRNFVTTMMEQMFQKVNIKTPEIEAIMKNIESAESNFS